MEFILTFIIVFIVIVWVMGKFLPLVLQWYIKRKIKKMGGGNAGYYNEKFNDIKSKKEGEVTVTGEQQQEKVIKKDVGEYIDFEENE